MTSAFRRDRRRWRRRCCSPASPSLMLCKPRRGPPANQGPEPGQRAGSQRRGAAGALREITVRFKQSRNRIRKEWRAARGQGPGPRREVWRMSRTPPPARIRRTHRAGHVDVVSSHEPVRADEEVAKVERKPVAELMVDLRARLFRVGHLADVVVHTAGADAASEGRGSRCRPTRYPRSGVPVGVATGLDDARCEGRRARASREAEN